MMLVSFLVNEVDIVVGFDLIDNFIGICFFYWFRGFSK